MSIGKVTFYSEEKGYGFIMQVDGREVYFHYTAIAEVGPGKAMEPGISVAYDLIETHTGLEAANIRRTAPIAV